jgi:hypothetical protein
MYTNIEFSTYNHTYLYTVTHIYVQTYKIHVHAYKYALTHIHRQSEWKSNNARRT